MYNSGYTNRRPYLAADEAKSVTPPYICRLEIGLVYSDAVLPTASAGHSKHAQLLLCVQLTLQGRVKGMRQVSLR